MKWSQSPRHLPAAFEVQAGESNRRRLQRLLRQLLRGEVTFPESNLVKRRAAKSAV